MEKNEISKALKKKLNDAGLTHLRVKGGTGTAWGWIDLWCGKDDGMFSESDQKKLFEIGITDREVCKTNCICNRLKEWESIINKPKNDDTLTDMKKLFYEIAQSKEDLGTCCGGSGVYVFKDGVRIDFWKNNFAQSSDPLHETVRELNDAFAYKGLSLTVEDGWMD